MRNTQTSRKLYNHKVKTIKQTLKDVGATSNEELLLLQQPSEVDSVFDKLNIRSNKDVVKSKTYEYNSINAYSNIYDGYEVYSASQIKDIAIEYNLSIRTIDKIKGILPNKIATHITEFVTKFNLPIVDSGFYVLTQKKYFKGAYRDKPIDTYIIFYLDKSQRDYIRKIGERDTLVQITSSGNDFSELNKIGKFFDFDYSYYRTSENFLPVGVVSTIFTILYLLLMLISTVNANYILASIVTFLFISLIFVSNNFFNFKSDEFWNK